MSISDRRRPGNPLKRLPAFSVLYRKVKNSIPVILLCGIYHVSAQHGEKRDRYRLEILPGVWYGNQSWSIAGNIQGENPDILSELSWSGLRGPGVQIRGEGTVWKNMVIGADLSVFFSTGGEATDTDYAGNNRTEKQFETNLMADKGENYTWNVTAGYLFNIGQRFGLIPAIGYGEQRQNLFLLDGEALNSSYKTRWKGPVFRLSAFYSSRIWEVTCTFTYAQQQYYAAANWNLIDAFAHPVSFEHKAKGHHFSGIHELIFLPERRFSPLLFVSYETGSTGTGTDTLYLAEGGREYTRFNGVSRSSTAIGAGVKLSF
ncbi:hypothetical protein [Sinomicrobium sp. M5D2P17]